MVHGHKPRLIALTGWGSPMDRKMSSEAGFDLHLVKPIDYSELLHHVEAALDSATESLQNAHPSVALNR